MTRAHVVTLGLFVTFGLLADRTQACAQEPILRPETFQAWEGGGFLSKTWKELGD